MVELKFGLRTIDLPYKLRLYDVAEAMFDNLVDEDTKAELIDGVMIVHSPAPILHDNLAGFLRTLMRCYSDEKALGLVLGPDSLVRLRPRRRFGPDLFFVAQKRLRRRLPVKQFKGVPDLVVEVLSPSNWEEDMEEKRPRYQEAGVREMWWVEPDEQQITVDRRRKRGYAEAVVSTGKLTSSVLSGFWIDVCWLWEEPLPSVMDWLREILE
jgi:Uma2 family endonuclease